MPRRTRFGYLTVIVLASISVTAQAQAQAQAQSNPDFSDVDDILHGNRTLVQVTDLEMIYLDPNNGPTFDQIRTSNSQQTQGGPFNWGLQGIDASKSVLNISAHMFNQPGATTISTLHSFNNAFALWLQGIANVGTTSAWTPLAPGDEPDVNCGAAADFTNDGFDDLALGLADGRILVVSPNDTNPFAQPFSGSFHSSTPLATLDVLKAMAAGDFLGDAQHEIAGLSVTPQGGLKLVIYTVDPGTLAVTSAVTPLVLNTPGTSAGNPIVKASLARGHFNTLLHDQLAVAFATNSGVAYVEVIDFTPNTLTPFEASPTPLFTPDSGVNSDGYLQIKTGQFGLPNSNYDSIVYHSSSPASNGRYFEVLKVDSATLAVTGTTPVGYNAYPCSEGIQVGNFDHQQTDPLNPAQNEHNPNAQVAFLYCTQSATPNLVMNIYSVDSTSLTLNQNPDSAVAIDPRIPFSPNISFVSVDLQGRSMVLGEPTKVTINNTTPTIINSVPPMHVDYVIPVGGSKPEVLNISFIPDGFDSSYSLVQNSTTNASTTGTKSWSAGVNESGSAAVTFGDPDEGTGARFKVGFKAAQDFAGSTGNSDSNFQASQFGLSATTKKGDLVYYYDSRLNIWVYPVIGQTACPSTIPNCTAAQQKPLTVQFSGPDEIQTGNVSTEDPDTFWYQPPWEYGNIFSYPATKAQLALIYPDIASTQLSSDVSFDTNPSSTKIQASWSSGSEQGSTSSFSDNFSFDLSTTYVLSSGAKYIGDVSTKETLDVSGSFGFDQLHTNTAQMDASNGIEITSTAIFPDTSNYGYTVSPFILGNPPANSSVKDSTQPPQANITGVGPLKTAFTADPPINPVNGPNWWRTTYSSAPDVSLNHPTRWSLTEPELGNPIPDNCGNTGGNASQMDCVDISPYFDDSGVPLDPWVSDFLSMRGFFITSASNPGAGPQLGYATAGDKLDLAVRVYNYSLASMPNLTTVHVRFYATPMDGNGNALGNSFLIGETSADPIPPFQDSTTDLNWRLIHVPAPGLDTTPYGGDYLAFWVVVWMQDGNGSLVKELPGHGLTSIPGTLTKPSDVPVEMGLNTKGQPASFSNNVGFYRYALPVLTPSTGLGAPPPSNPTDFTLRRVSAAKKRVQAGDLDVITAVLKSGLDGAGRVKVSFYDGNPAENGELIGTQIAWLKPSSLTQVRIPYHAASDGVHRVWAVIFKGKPDQMEAHTSAIIVGRRSHDCHDSDCIERPSDRDDRSEE